MRRPYVLLSRKETTNPGTVSRAFYYGNIREDINLNFQRTTKQMELKVLTYNIWGMPWGTKYIHEILLWIFCTSGAEVVCLQEVFSKRHREIIEIKAAAAHWQVFFPEDTCLAGMCLNSFRSGSGLCILVSPKLQVIHEIPFVAFSTVDSYVEKLVKKGFFGLQLEKEGKFFSLLNTHMVSDMTECRPFRIAHGHSRRLQEKQLVEAAKTLRGPVLIAGDLNQEEHHYLHRMYDSDDWTFPDTMEQLDHVVCLHSDRKLFRVDSVKFFQEIKFSDHIPLRVDLQFQS
jgi:endonuclease/exonuclease/phosphatase family metal-dependent hydrolase